MNYAPLFKRVASLTLLCAFALAQAGCLKTRAQLRQEQGEDQEEETAEKPKASQYQLEEIKAEITRVSGKVEELEHHQQTANLAAMKESLTKLEVQMQDVEKSQMLIMTELKAIKDGANQAKAHEAEVASVRSKPRDALARGYAALEEKKLDEASEIFKKLIEAKPGAKENAEAHFGMGQVQYLEKDYKKAIVTLSKVQELHAKSARVPASLYLIARSFEKLNMKKEATGFYAELQERFPKSPEAKKAKGKP